jgi:ssDNA-binding Zn-finger/Zn-ribbon topoisomerase 1
VGRKCDSCGFPYLVERSTKAKGDFLACPKCRATIVIEEKAEEPVGAE